MFQNGHTRSLIVIQYIRCFVNSISKHVIDTKLMSNYFMKFVVVDII
jgi:hypothetical protein